MIDIDTDDNNIIIKHRSAVASLCNCAKTKTNNETQRVSLVHAPTQELALVGRFAAPGHVGQGGNSTDDGSNCCG
jgi:hypothetical protein